VRAPQKGSDLKNTVPGLAKIKKYNKSLRGCHVSKITSQGLECFPNAINPNNFHGSGN
jgi:hypothetical protein